MTKFCGFYIVLLYSFNFKISWHRRWVNRWHIIFPTNGPPAVELFEITAGALTYSAIYIFSQLAKAMANSGALTYFAIYIFSQLAKAMANHTACLEAVMNKFEKPQKVLFRIILLIFYKLQQLLQCPFKHITCMMKTVFSFPILEVMQKSLKPGLKDDSNYSRHIKGGYYFFSIDWSSCCCCSCCCCSWCSYNMKNNWITLI